MKITSLATGKGYAIANLGYLARDLPIFFKAAAFKDQSGKYTAD